MRYSLCAAAFAALAVAAPVEERQAAPGGPNDAQILNYALTLEHLENAFYKQVLGMFSAEDFKKAGLPDNFQNNLKEISSDEQTHVSFLQQGLAAAGAGAVAPCTYNFGLTDVNSFLATANILEGVGVSAYLGAAQFITSPAYLTAAGSILTVEARHSAYLRENQKPKAASPFPSPFDIPLDFNEVYSLAALFITGCPAGNAANLPALQAFPGITIAPGLNAAGDKIKATVASDVPAKAAFFITSGGSVSAPLTGSGKAYEVTVPKGVQAGQEYLVLTKDTNAPTDDNIVAIGVDMIKDNAFYYQQSRGGWWDKQGHWHGGKKPSGYKNKEYSGWNKHDSPKGY